MKVIAGCVIKKDNKILMVKEASKNFFGQWNFPAGHVEEFEKITDAAIRETLEETGCKVKLTGVLPIANVNLKEETHILIRFTAEIVEEDFKFEEDEILDVKWLEIEDIKNMPKEKLRGYELAMQTINNIENQTIFPLEVIDNKPYEK